MQFPRVIYHAALGHKRIDSEAEHKIFMSHGWQDEPIAAAEPPAAVEPPSRLDAIEARLDALEAKRKR